MNGSNSQRGVGLIEVMVAVLLLSIAVLGFSALQMRAVSATDESLVRTKSLTVVRNLAEVMRAYPEAYVIGSGTTFTSAISAAATKEVSAADSEGSSVTLTAQPTIQAVMSSSATNTVSIDGTAINISGTNNCLSTETKIVDSKNVPIQSCNINQLAARDALMVKKTAADEDIKVTVVMCPGTSVQAIQKQMCVITAWNDTKAILDDSDGNACATSDGVYKTSSHCLISEAY